MKSVCSECGRDSFAAGPLADGHVVRLCGDCITAAAVDLETRKRGPSILWSVLSQILGALPDATPLEASLPYIDAAAALGGGDPPTVRWVANEAARLAHADRAVELLAGLGTAATADDRVSHAYYAFLSGDSLGGLAQLALVDDDELDERGRVYFHLNRAALRLELESTPEAITTARADMGLAADLIEGYRHRLPHPELQMLRGAVHLGHGRVALAERRWDEARRQLTTAIEKYSDTRAFVLVLLGDALAGTGDRAAAEEQWARAAQAAPDGSHHAELARRRLDGPYR